MKEAQSATSSLGGRDANGLGTGSASCRQRKSERQHELFQVRRRLSNAKHPPRNTLQNALPPRPATTALGPAQSAMRSGASLAGSLRRRRAPLSQPQTEGSKRHV